MDVKHRTYPKPGCEHQTGQLKPGMDIRMQAERGNAAPILENIRAALAIQSLALGAKLDAEVCVQTSRGMTHMPLWFVLKVTRQACKDVQETVDEVLDAIAAGHVRLTANEDAIRPGVTTRAQRPSIGLGAHVLLHFFRRVHG